MDVRAGYKLTAVGVVPEDWVVINIGEVASFASGQGIHIASLKDESSDSPVPVYGGNGVAGYTVAALTHEPTLVVGRVGQKCGEVYLTTGPAWITDNALYPRRFLRKPDVRFLALAIQATGLNSLRNRNDLPLVTQSILHAVKICLPPSEAEQRAIAAALYDVDALLDGLDRLIAKKRDLMHAAMQNLLTGQTRLPGFHGEWKVSELGKVAEVVMGQSPNSSNYNSSGLGLPLIQGNADISGRKTMRRIFTTQVTKRGNAGDVLMSVRAPVGEVSQTMFDVCLGRGVCAIRFPNEYLYYLLILLEPSWAKHSKGSTFDSVNSTDVRAVEVNLPTDPSEQLAIARVLSDMDTELVALEARRDKTRALKRAMMQELLTGRTRLLPAEGADA